MLIKNHLFMSLVLSGILLTVSNATFAADDPTSFTSLSVCRNHFNTKVQAGNENPEVSDPWCKARMTALDYCAERDLINAIYVNSYNSTQIPALRQRMVEDCQRRIAAGKNSSGSGGATTANASAGASAASSNSCIATNCSAGASWDANGAPCKPAAPAQQNCTVVPAAEQGACNTNLARYQQQLQVFDSNFNTCKKRVADAAAAKLKADQDLAAKQVQTGVQVSQALAQATAPVWGAGRGTETATRGALTYGQMQQPQGTLPTARVGGNASGQQQAAAGGNGGQQNGSGSTMTSTTTKTVETPFGKTTTTNSFSVTTGGNSGSQGGTQAGGTGGNGNQAAANVPTPTKAEADKMIADAQKEMKASEADVASLGEDAKKKAGDVSNNADGENTPVPKSQITQAAEKGSQLLETDYQQFLTQLKQITTPGTLSLPFTNTYQAFQAFEAAGVKPLNTSRSSVCAPATERTEQLCVEGSSPGAKAARALMDTAGPILGMISSAQKACSKTAKVATMVGAGLTIANTVCIVTKMKCETTCGQALGKFQQSATTTKTTGTTALTTETSTALAACGKDLKTVKACIEEVREKNAFAKAAIVNFDKIVASEGQPSEGTFAGLSAKCKDKARNIVSMIGTIGGIALSRASAQKCADELATTQGAGGPNANVTTAEYCTAAETSGSQFCKCQSNPSAEGCAGSLAGGGLNSGDANNQLGADLKAARGLNGFAGGGRNPSSSSNFNLGSGGAGDSVGGQLGALEAGKSAFGGPSGAGMGGAVAAGANGAGSGGTTAAGATNAEKQGDKKWNFGAFTATGGGAIGGRGGTASGNGNLTSQQEQALERRLAAERYAAEVTTSTGKSNFDKVKFVIRQISSTLDPNQ